MEETRVPFVTETVDLQHKSEAFLAKYEEANPGGRAKVPIVEIDGLVLTESAVVVEYLAEKDGPGPFYLEDPARRLRLMAEVHLRRLLQFLKLRDDPEALAAARMVPTLKHYVDVDVRRLCEPFPRVDRLVSAVLARWTVRKTGVPEDKLIEGMDKMLARIAAQAPPP
ncbi:chloride channel [Aureococcus anophagefferens]|nr:chloride channel [Aureococcus anophagefferens]